jgi:hypothetical protein
MEKRLKNIQTFEQHSSELNISDVSDNTGEYIDIIGSDRIIKVGEHPHTPNTYSNIYKVWVDYEPNDTKETLQIKAKALYYRWLRSEISSLDKDRKYYR